MSIITDPPFHDEDNKFQAATEQAESALRALSIGEDALAMGFMDEAQHTDPEALATALQREKDSPDAPSATHDVPPPASDKEVAAITRTVQPGVDAPSRAGIVDGNGDMDGSGADGQKR